jgi:2-iminobutanoate/2-iminopropanoate deaminase
MQEKITVADAPTPGGHYSQGIVAGPFVFVAGQGPLDVTTGSVPEGITAQTNQVLRNLEAILRGAGCSLANVVKVTAHLADLGEFDDFNAAYSEYFPEPLPVRTTVGSILKGILVEIDVIAYRAEQ